MTIMREFLPFGTRKYEAKKFIGTWLDSKKLNKFGDSRTSFELLSNSIASFEIGLE
uniref:Uncharacterized protein n=1 Tax=Physcomitrium patens TaxID=3218 RepID=A0A2K1L3M9_PHYPA|nr:hypothetical protein PHYPA_003427 [Physcomitrium patens]